MARYRFSPASMGATPLAAARKAATANGATVLRAIAGSMLIEVPPSKVDAVADAIPGWKYSAERRTATVPERSPLQRAKLATEEH